MQITRSSSETQQGPADWFTGDVHIDAVAIPAGTSTFAAADTVTPPIDRRSRVDSGHATQATEVGPADCARIRGGSNWSRTTTTKGLRMQTF